MGALWFANRPVIPAICKVSNKKAPCSSMYKMLKYAPIQILLMDFLLTRSAHCTKDSYFIVPHWTLRIFFPFSLP